MSPSTSSDESPPKTARSRNSVLRTDRLVLTTWTSEDLPDLDALHSDPVAMKHMTSGALHREQTRACLLRWRAEHSARGWSKWRIEAVNQKFVGRAGFGRAHNTRHREVGYLLASQFWGQGLATELLRALTRWHHDHLDDTLDPDLLAYVFPANTASRHALEKVGFEHVEANPRDSDQLLYRHRNHG